MYFVNIFSKSVACPFILLTVSYEEEKFLTPIKTSLSTISVVDCAFGVVSEETSQAASLQLLRSCCVLIQCGPGTCFVEWQLSRLWGSPRPIKSPRKESGLRTTTILI